MFLDSLRSIKDDLSRSIFYWLTFVMTSMFIFLFFNLSYSDMVGVHFINSQNNMSTFITVMVITICMIVIFFANDFFVKKKAKDLAVRLVCGSTYLQIAKYLLYQTGILLFIAIPVGIACAIGLIPFVNMFLVHYLHSQEVITIQASAIYSTILILSIVIIWCTILNLGYSFRNSIKTLLTDDKMIPSSLSLPSFYNLHIDIKIKKALSWILFLGPIIGIYYYGSDVKSILAFSVIGMIGFYMFLDKVFISYLNEMTHQKKTNQPITLITFGLLRNNIKVLKKNIILLIVSDILLIALMVSCLKNPIEMMLALISFVVMNILLSLSIMFKLSTEVSTRKKIYDSIERIGYMKDSQKKILKNEILSFYGFIFICSLLYIANIFISLILRGFLESYLCLILVFIFMFPLFLCAIMNSIYYRKVIL